MGTGAQIGEVALLIEGDDGVLGQVLDELHLVGLLLLLHELDGLLTGQLEALQLQLLLADLAHLSLQGGQILGGEGAGSVKIVVEPVLDAGADGQLPLGVQPLHGLSQHVGAGVPIGLAVLGIFKAEFVLDFFGHNKKLLSDRWGKEKRFTPDLFSGVKRKKLHGSTLLARKKCGAPGSRATVTRADRKTGRAQPGGIFGGAWSSWPLRRVRA